MDFLRGITTNLPTAFNITAVREIVDEKIDESGDVELHFNLSESFERISVDWWSRGSYKNSSTVTNDRIIFTFNDVNSGYLTFLNGGYVKSKKYYLWDCWLLDKEKKEDRKKKFNISKKLSTKIHDHYESKYLEDMDTHELNAELSQLGMNDNEIKAFLFSICKDRGIGLVYDWCKTFDSHFEYQRQLSRFRNAFIDNDPKIHDNIRVEILRGMSKPVCRFCLHENTATCCDKQGTPSNDISIPI